MTLFDLYQTPAMWTVPYELLREREPHQNISHKTLPTWEEHCNFIRSHPYKAWYLFMTPVGEPAGCVYLSRQREIGIGVLKRHQGQGYGTRAVETIMELHPGKFGANINPANKASIAMFQKLGFLGPVQLTFEKT